MPEPERRDVRDQFDEDGFVIVRQFLPRNEFDNLRAELQRYIDTVVPHLPDADAFYDDRSRPETLKQLQHMAGDPFFNAYLGQPRWSRLAESLLGEPATARDSEWFNKPAGTNHETPPHQDNFYFNLEPPQVVTLWLALEDIDEENGCLRYVRGSHLAGRRSHSASNVLGFSQGIVDFCDKDRELEVPVELRANDLVAHHGWTIHRADANLSTTRGRRAFAMVFRGLSCRVDQVGLQRYEASLREQHESLGLDGNPESRGATSE